MRILQVFAEPLSNGGQESFVMNMYKNIDKTNIHFDFFTPYYCDNLKRKEKIEELGGRVFAQDRKFETIRRKNFFIKELTKFLKNNNYEIVHIHSGSTFALAYGAKIAKRYGAKKIIVHSHSTGINNLKHKVIKILSKRIFLRNVTKYVACSKEAAAWKFPKKIIKENQFTVINNGIELEKFIYNEVTREKYRNKLNISKQEFVIGHVGRFESEKNHVFLIDVFEEVAKRDQHAKLLLVGTGSLKQEIIKKITEKHLQEKVIFLENRDDVNNVLQAIDVFVFPSIFEGLPVVVIEAQAAGLQTICSENVTQETKVTNLFHNIEIKFGKEKWAEEILKYRQYDRKNTAKEIQSKGFDAKQSAKTLEKIYTK